MTKIIEKSYELIERVFDYVEKDYTLDDYKHINNNKSLIVNTLYDLKYNIDLMINDILLFPFVMADYDSITKDNEGKLILEKWISHNYRVVVIITRKRKNITLKSMYITKKGRINLSQSLMIPKNPYQVLRPKRHLGFLLHPLLII